jgi:UDP-2,3-diacylglucosamine pyrophosphatase LpxH
MLGKHPGGESPKWVPSSLHHKSRPSLALRFLINSNLDKYYYRKMAAAAQGATAARYVVFGHTHEADLHGLGSTKEGKRLEYVNSGSWTKCFAGNPEEALLKSENEFVYVHIGYDDRKKDVKMDLLRWNDELQAGERVRLFK